MRIAPRLAIGLCLLFALLPFLPALAGSPPPVTWRMRVVLPAVLDAGEVARAFQDEGIDVAAVNRERGVLEVIGGEDLRLRLAARGWRPEILETYGPSTDAGSRSLDQYMEPSEIAARLEQLEAAHPEIAKRFAYATTHEGRTAWAMKISDNVDAEEDEPAILFVAQHHAREVMTPEVAMDMIERLLDGYGVDPEITRWVDDYEIWVLPCHNPDGSDYVFHHDNMWRKNRRDNGDGTFGVDPNRNYPFQWGGTVCNGSSGSTSSETYRGPSAGSEPITAGIMDLARQHRPVYAVSWHTYSELVLHSYGCDGELPGRPDLLLIRELAGELAAKMVSDDREHWYEFGSAAELLYEVDGEWGDWFYAELGVPNVTFELNASAQGFQPDYDQWRDDTVQRARAGWKYFLRRMEKSRVTGHVTDACTGAPLEATVGLSEQVLPNGETERTSEPGFGRFDIPVLPGSYHVEASLAGYRGQQWPVEVAFAPVSREIRLVPEGSQAIALSRVDVLDGGEGDGDGRLDPGETVDLSIEAYATGEAVTGATVSVSCDDPYVTVLDGSATIGDIAAGERRANPADDPVTLRIAPDAPEGHEVTLHVAFSAVEELCSAAEDRELTVTKGVRACPAVEETMDEDPGWEIDNGGAADGWEFGHPDTTGGPSGCATGDTCYGTNLDGNYGSNGRFELTAGPYDLSTLTDPELRFARWLTTETGFDIARVLVRAGSDGDWQEAWSGFGRDAEWVETRYDLSPYVDRDEEVWIRFELETDGATTRAGFYVDDFRICGEELPGPGGRLKYRDHAVDDSDPAYGNGNGRWDEGETITLEVQVINTSDQDARAVSGVLSTDTPGVTIRNRVADWPDVASGGTGWSLAPHFTVTAESGCGTEVTFELEMRWNDGSTSTSTFTVPIGVVIHEDVLLDDFEEDRGWTAGGDAHDGLFVREDPHGVDDTSVGPVQPEDDHTEFPGELCWVTGNPVPGPGFAPEDGDVDIGTAFIESPTFDGTGEGTLYLEFARWFHRTKLNPLDEADYKLEVSNDGGATWTEVEKLETSASAWQVVRFDLDQFVPRSSNMKLRFSARELKRQPGDPLVELLIDDVHAWREKEECDPFTPTEDLPPNPVGNTVRVTRRRFDVRLEWTAPSTDADHGPARFFPVWRSGRPDGGFDEVGSPTATFHVDVDAGGPSSGTYFYLVSAENAAGDSGEAP